MTMRNRRRRACLRPLAAFELRRMLRSPTTAAAVVTFTAVLALGHWIARGDATGADDDRLFGYAFLLAAMIGWRLNLATDRVRGFEDFAVPNLAGPARYVAGKLVAAALWLGCLATFAFVAGLALSAGDLRYAVWYPPVFALVVWSFVPVLAAVELVIDTRVPAVVVALLFATIATGSAAFGSVEAPFRILGLLPIERYRPETLGPLLLRVFVVVPSLLAVLVAVFRTRPTRRSRRRDLVPPESAA